MADDADNLTVYRNDRDGNVLRISLTANGVNLTTTGGGNVSQAEYDQIATFVAGHVGAASFQAKLQARMAR